MKVTFVSTSNTKYKYFEGMQGELYAKSECSASFYPDTHSKYLMTSVVDVIKMRDTGLITLKTLNSEYIFQLMEETEDTRIENEH